MNPKNADNSGVPQDVLEAFGQKPSAKNTDVPKDVLDAFSSQKKNQNSNDSSDTSVAATSKLSSQEGTKPISPAYNIGNPISNIIDKPVVAPLTDNPSWNIADVGTNKDQFDIKSKVTSKVAQDYNSKFRAAAAKGELADPKQGDGDAQANTGIRVETNSQDFDLKAPIAAKEGTLKKLLLGDLNEKRNAELENNNYQIYKKKESEVQDLSQKIYFGDESLTGKVIEDAVNDPLKAETVKKLIIPFLPEGSSLDFDTIAKNIQIENRKNGVNAILEGSRRQTEQVKNNISELNPELNPNINYDNPEEIKGLMDRLTEYAGEQKSLANAKIQPSMMNDEFAMKQYSDLAENAKNKRDAIMPMIAALDARMKIVVSQQPISKSVVDMGDKLDTMIFSNITKINNGDTPDNDQRKVEQWKRGLTYVEKANPVLFGFIKKGLESGDGFAESDFGDIAKIGQDLDNVNRYFKGATDPSMVGASKTFDYTTREEKKAAAAAILGEAGYKSDIAAVFSYSPKEIDGLIAKSKGQLDALKIDKSILDELKREEAIPDYDAIPKGSWYNDIMSSVVQPMADVNSTIRTYFETPIETYLRSKKLDMGGSQKIIGSDGSISDILESQRNLGTDIIRGFGQFGGQLVLTNVAAIPLRLATEAAYALKATKAIKDLRALSGVTNPMLQGTLAAQTANKITDIGGTFISTYLQTYGSSFAEHLAKTGDAGKASIIGFIDGVSSAAFEGLILPETKIARDAMKRFKGEIAEDLFSIINKKGITNAEKLAELSTKGRGIVLRALEPMANVLVQENKEELGTQIVDYFTELIFDPQSGKQRSLSNELVQTAKQTTASMIGPAIFAGGGVLLNRNEDFTRNSLHAMASNFSGFKEGLQEQLKSGAINQKQLNTAVSLVATHRQSLINAPETNSSGLSLTDNEKLDYSFETTKIAEFAKKKESLSPISEKVQIEVWDNKIKEAEQAQRDILNTTKEKAAAAKQEIFGGVDNLIPKDVIRFSEIEQGGNGKDIGDNVVLKDGRSGTVISVEKGGLKVKLNDIGEYSISGKKVTKQEFSDFFNSPEFDQKEMVVTGDKEMEDKLLKVGGEATEINTVTAQPTDNIFIRKPKPETVVEEKPKVSVVKPLSDEEFKAQQEQNKVPIATDETSIANEGTDKAIQPTEEVTTPTQNEKVVEVGNKVSTVSNGGGDSEVAAFKAKQRQIEKHNEPPLPITENTDNSRKEWNDANYEVRIDKLESDKERDVEKIKKGKIELSYSDQLELNESNKWYEDKISEYKKERSERLQEKRKVTENTLKEAENDPKSFIDKVKKSLKSEVSIDFIGQGRRKREGVDEKTIELAIMKGGKQVGVTGFIIRDGKVHISFTEVYKSKEGVATELYKDINNSLEENGFGVLHSDETFLNTDQKAIFQYEGKEYSIKEIDKVLTADEMVDKAEDGSLTIKKKIKPGEALWQSLERKGLAEKDGDVYKFISKTEAKQPTTIPKVQPTEEVKTDNIFIRKQKVDEVGQPKEGTASFEDKVRSLYPTVKNLSDADVNDFIKENATDSPSQFIKDFGEQKFSEVVKDIPLEELKSKQKIVEQFTPESENADIFNKLISEREDNAAQPNTIVSKVGEVVDSKTVIEKSKIKEGSALADDVNKMGQFVEVEINPRRINISETPDARKRITANSTNELPHIVVDDIIKGQIHILDGSNRVAFAREKGGTIKAFVPKSRIEEFNKLTTLENDQLKPLEQTQRTNEPFPTEPIKSKVEGNEPQPINTKGNDRNIPAKRGVRELFASDTKLADELINVVHPNKENITGAEKQYTQKLYSEYIDSIFPESEVKDVLWHSSSNNNIEQFDFKFFGSNSDKGMFGVATYLEKDRGDSLPYNRSGKGKSYGVVVNMKNSAKFKDITDYISMDESQEAIQKRKDYLHKNNDGAILGDWQYAVFDNNNTHILGSKKDIQGFKDFVAKINTKGNEQNKATTSTANNPIQSDEGKQKGQVNKGSIQKSADGIGQGNADATASGPLNKDVPESVSNKFEKESKDNNFSFIKSKGSIWKRDNKTGEITNEGKSNADFTLPKDNQLNLFQIANTPIAENDPLSELKGLIQQELKNKVENGNGTTFENIIAKATVPEAGFTEAEVTQAYTELVRDSGIELANQKPEERQSFINSITKKLNQALSVMYGKKGDYFGPVANSTDFWKIVNGSDKNIKLDVDKNITLQKIKDYAADVSSNRKEIRRLSREAEQGREGGGIRNVEATILLATGGSEFKQTKTGEAKFQQQVGEIYGAVKDGKILLNMEKINPNTPLHEVAGHVWLNWASTNNKPVYNRGMKIVERSKYYDDIRKNPFYQNQAAKFGEPNTQGYTNYLKEEALATAIGDKGAQFITDAKRKTFQEWAKTLWDAVAKAVGFKNVTAEQLQNMSLEEFANRANADILKGEPVVADGVNIPLGNNVPPASPIDEKVKDFDGEEVVGNAYAITDEMAARLGAPLYDRDYTPESNEEWMAEARKRIANGELEGLLDNLANNQKTNIPDTVINKMLGIEVERLSEVALANPSVENMRKFSAVKSLSSDVVGRERGRGLVSMKGMYKPSALDDIADVMRAATNKDSKGNLKGLVDIPQAEKEQIIAEWNEREEKKNKLVELNAQQIELGKSDLEKAKKEIDKLRKEIKSLSARLLNKTGKKETGKDYTEKKKNIAEKLLAMLKIADENGAQESIRFSIVNAGNPFYDDGTGFDAPVNEALITPEFAKELKGLVKMVVENDSKISLENLVNDVFDTVQGKVSKTNILKIINGEFDKKPTRSQAKSSLNILKREIELIRKIQQLKAGEVGVKNYLQNLVKTKGQKNAELAALEGELESLQKIEGNKPPKIKDNSDEAKNLAAQKIAERGIAELQDKLDKNDLAVEKSISLNETQKTKDLRAERTKLGEDLENKRKEAKVGKYSDSAKNEVAQNAAQKSIDAIQTRLDNNELEVEQSIKLNEDAKTKQLREQRKQLREELEKRKKEAKVGKYSDEYKAAKAQESIDELQKKIDSNDLEIKKPETLTGKRKELQDKQKALRKELEQKRKDAKVGRYSESSIRAKSLERLQAKYDKELKDYNDGKFIKEKKVRVIRDLSKDEKVLLDRIAELDLKQQMRLDKYEREKKPWLSKAIEDTQNVLGLRRAIMSAVDISILARQAAPVTLNVFKWIPTMTSEGLKMNTAPLAIKKMGQLLFNPKGFARYQYQLEQSDIGKLFLESKGVFSNPSEVRMEKREEQYFSNIMTRAHQKMEYSDNKAIRGIAKGFDKLWFSERAAATLLNTMRIEEFAKGVEDLDKLTLSAEDRKDKLQALARWAMNITGRGNLLFEDSAGMKILAGRVYFGARLMAATINRMNPATYIKAPKELQRKMLADMAGHYATITALAASLAALGGSVTLDPDDPDFMKVRFGQIVYDITGGASSYYRTAFRIMQLARMRVNGTRPKVANAYARFAGSSLTGTLVTNKLAPNTSYALQFLTGKGGGYDANGKKQDFNPYDIFHIWPMWVDGMADAYKAEGTMSAATAVFADIVGIGTMTYENRGNEWTGKQKTGSAGGGSGATGQSNRIP